MPRSLLLLAAVAVAALAAVSVSAAGPAIVDDAPSFLVNTYFIDMYNKVHGQVWEFDLASSSGVITANQVVADTRPTFPKPGSAYPSSLRRDSSLYVASSQSLITLHPNAPRDASVERTEVSAYAMHLNETTLVQAIEEFSFGCSVYDNKINMVLGLSAWVIDDNTWNVSLVALESNGDDYSSQLMWTQVMSNPLGSPEDPWRPLCAHDSTRGLFSFHWPAADTAKGLDLGGRLLTLNVTLSAESGLPVAESLANNNWPSVWPPTTDPSVQPVVLGLAYTNEPTPRLAYVAKWATDRPPISTHCGILDPLAGTDLVMPILAPPVDEYVKPLLAVTGDTVLIMEYVSPFRVVQWDTVGRTVVESKINFYAVADFTKLSIIGVHQNN